MKLKLTSIIVSILISMIPVAGGADQQTQDAVSNSDTEWQRLADGFELGVFRSPLPSAITILAPEQAFT